MDDQTVIDKRDMIFGAADRLCKRRPYICSLVGTYEDVRQTAFMHIWRYRAKLPQDASDGFLAVIVSRGITARVKNKLRQVAVGLPLVKVLAPKKTLQGEDHSAYGAVVEILPGDKAVEDNHVRDVLNALLVGQLLNTLTSRQREIVVLRYGLDGGGERSYGEVAELLGVGKDRVNQALQIAHQHMRNYVGGGCE